MADEGATEFGTIIACEVTAILHIQNWNRSREIQTVRDSES